MADRTMIRLSHARDDAVFCQVDQQRSRDRRVMARDFGECAHRQWFRPNKRPEDKIRAGPTQQRDAQALRGFLGAWLAQLLDRVQVFQHGAARACQPDLDASALPGGDSDPVGHQMVQQLPRDLRMMLGRLREAPHCQRFACGDGAKRDIDPLAVEQCFVQTGFSASHLVALGPNT